MNTEATPIRKNMHLELPVNLTDSEMLESARTKARLELQLEEMQGEASEAKREWAKRLEEVEHDIARYGAELRTGTQKRVVECVQRYVKEGEHAGKVETVRLDTGDVVRRHAADLLEARGVVEQDDGTADEIMAAAARQQRDGVVENEDGDVVPSEEAAPRRAKKR